MNAGLAGIGWIDWAFLAVIVISVVVGLVRGLVYEVMSLLGWVLAFVAAYGLSGRLAPAMPVGAAGPALELALAFLALFVGTLLVWSLLSWLLRKLVQASPLGSVDRVLGAAFGLLRGALIALVAATAVSLTPLAQSGPWRASHGAAGLQEVLAGLRPLLPVEVARHLPA